MTARTQTTNKRTVVTKWGDGHKFWMAPGEYTGVVVGKEATGGDYAITDGVIRPGGHVPEHYHKWEDQTFHVIHGVLEARIGGETHRIEEGDTIHCPRGVPHYLRNLGDTTAKVISYIFPGHWVEDFMAETARQNTQGQPDFDLIEERFGVVYL